MRDKAGAKYISATQVPLCSPRLIVTPTDGPRRTRLTPPQMAMLSRVDVAQASYIRFKCTLRLQLSKFERHEHIDSESLKVFLLFTKGNAKLC